jgi:hypothetical protein
MILNTLCRKFGLELTDEQKKPIGTKVKKKYICMYKTVPEKVKIRGDMMVFDYPADWLVKYGGRTLKNIYWRAGDKETHQRIISEMRNYFNELNKAKSRIANKENKKMLKERVKFSI